MEMESVERIEKVLQQSLASRYIVFYGPGIEDSYISTSGYENGIEKTLQLVLNNIGFEDVAFISPHKPIYSFNSFAATAVNEPPRPRIRRMSFLQEGPLRDMVLLPGRKVEEDDHEGYSDLHSIRYLDTMMKRQGGKKSAVVFVQAETYLAHVEDQRSMAGIIGEWKRLPSEVENVCIFLFSAVDIQRLQEIAQSIRIPELKAEILENTQSVIFLEGPQDAEALRLIHYVHQTRGIPMINEQAIKLSTWMAAEKRRALDWIQLLSQLPEISIDAVVESGWISSKSDPRVPWQDKLDELVGLESIKQRVSELAAWLTVQQRRKILSGSYETPLLHMIFTGNPGTGKTTVARLIGEIFHDIGILRRGHLIEVKAADMIAEFVGGTAQKTQNLINQALDGVLFIDEAYVLSETGRGGFGQEALDTLLTRMEDDRKQLVVIAAGYPDKMEIFLNSNPGLTRRFPQDNRFHFPDYKPDELVEIFNRMTRKKQLNVDESLSQSIQQISHSLYLTRDEKFGNAGEMRNLVDGIERRWAMRVVTEQKGLEMRALSCDIPTQYQYEPTDSAKQDSDLLESLKNMTGLVPIKSYINRLAAKQKVEAMRKGTLKAEFPNLKNLIFCGNPGTGKTTVARLLGKIYQSIGLLGRGQLIEVTRADLVAGYVGQTAIKTMETVHKALDGILFIDEAYSLSRGNQQDFGQEVIDTLVKAMDQNQNRLVIILAGYPQEMQQFLSRNPGLLSRFSTPLNFPDYSDEELVDIFLGLANKENLVLSPELPLALQELFGQLRARDQGRFGNGRTVRQLFEEMKELQAERLTMLAPHEIPEKDLFELRMMDIPPISYSFSLPVSQKVKVSQKK